MTKAQLSALIAAQETIAEYLSWALIEVRDAVAGRDFDADTFSEQKSALEAAISGIIDEIPDDADANQDADPDSEEE